MKRGKQSRVSSSPKHWYCSEPRLSFNKAVVIRYRFHLELRQLAPGTIDGGSRPSGVSRSKLLIPDCSPRICCGLRRKEAAELEITHFQRRWKNVA